MEKLILKRTEITEKYAKGELWYKDKMICYTLEDPPRDIKIMHETGIPEGTYQIIINYSPRFKRKLPLLLNVPDFEGIRIHKGNRTKDSSGCVLVGTTFNKDILLHSTSAFTIVFNLLTNLLKKNQVFIEVVNPEKSIIIQTNNITWTNNSLVALPQSTLTTLPKQSFLKLVMNMLNRLFLRFWTN